MIINIEEPYTFKSEHFEIIENKLYRNFIGGKLTVIFKINKLCVFDNEYGRSFSVKHEGLKSFITKICELNNIEIPINEKYNNFNVKFKDHYTSEKNMHGELSRPKRYGKVAMAVDIRPYFFKRKVGIVLVAKQVLALEETDVPEVEIDLSIFK